MDIIELDINDSSAVEQWFIATQKVRVHDIPDFPESTLECELKGLRHPWPGNREELWLAVENGNVVGYFQLSLPILDNLSNVEVDLCVLPERRRRGIGRALYAKAVERARANDRTTMIAMAPETLPGTGIVRDDAGNAFAAAMGAKRVHEDVRRRWEADSISEVDIRAQLTEAWKHAAGYELVTWRERVPDNLVESQAYLDSRLVKDAPMGGLAWEPENFDVARVRAGEEVAAARGRRQFAAGIVHSETGRLAAYTVIGMDGGTDWHGWQLITIADPDHRGHRLGTIVKLENVLFARSMWPELWVVDTWNAAVNQHMISINEAMGFRKMETWVNWQQKI
ncbi:MAG: GNAT family N-acetyltransferase [Longispora sp.]|nr:GNAT family N-acetyltransferase [Longispora sp. (in: high G+C Gram-positive bacteria)]